MLHFQLELDDDGAMNVDLHLDFLVEHLAVLEVLDDEVEVVVIDEIIALQHIDDEVELDLQQILLVHHLDMLVEVEDEVNLDDEVELVDEDVDEEMLALRQLELDELQVHTEADEDDELVDTVDELDVNECLYLDTKHQDDIIYYRCKVCPVFLPQVSLHQAFHSLWRVLLSPFH